MKTVSKWSIKGRTSIYRLQISPIPLNRFICLEIIDEQGFHSESQKILIWAPGEKKAIDIERILKNFSPCFPVATHLSLRTWGDFLPKKRMKLLPSPERWARPHPTRDKSLFVDKCLEVEKTWRSLWYHRKLLRDLFISIPFFLSPKAFYSLFVLWLCLVCSACKHVASFLPSNFFLSEMSLLPCRSVANKPAVSLYISPSLW